MNILLVDDEPDIVNNLGMLLQRLGHRCSIFYGTEGALMAAERSLFDVVITDLNMPGRNGLCFVKALRNLYDGLRAIIITGELNWAASHPIWRPRCSMFSTSPSTSSNWCPSSTR
jgi:DNA-binding NtrC family response regulator